MESGSSQIETRVTRLQTHAAVNQKFDAANERFDRMNDRISMLHVTMNEKFVAIKVWTLTVLCCGLGFVFLIAVARALH